MRYSAPPGGHPPARVKQLLGFGKPNENVQLGSSDHAFGWLGAGGSFGLAGSDAQIGFGYVMNRMGTSFTPMRALCPRRTRFTAVSRRLVPSIKLRSGDFFGVAAHVIGMYGLSLRWLVDPITPNG